MTARLDGKVIMVTGGSRGIGKAIVERVSAEGAAVVVGARRHGAGAEVAAGIRAAGGRAVFVPADVTVEHDVASLVDTAVAEFGRLDGAVNNVGGVTAFGRMSEVTEAGWRADLDLNLTSVFYGLKHQLPAVVAAGGGAIVNNASLLGVTGAPGMGPYVAAKHGVVGLSKAAALEYAKDGVRVNALITHAVDTPLLRGLLGDDPAAAADVAATIPTGRLSRPEEVAAFVAFLLGDESAFITGAALAIDGGATAG